MKFSFIISLSAPEINRGCLFLLFALSHFCPILLAIAMPSNWPCIAEVCFWELILCFVVKSEAHLTSSLVCWQVVENIARKYGVSKSDLLDREADDLAVRMALGETQVIAETKKALTNAGVNVASLEDYAAGKVDSVKRSKHVLLVKNLPYGSSENELAKMFGKFGGLDKIIIPSTKALALVCIHAFFFVSFVLCHRMFLCKCWCLRSFYFYFFYHLLVKLHILNSQYLCTGTMCWLEPVFKAVNNPGEWPCIETVGTLRCQVINYLMLFYFIFYIIPCWWLSNIIIKGPMYMISYVGNCSTYMMEIELLNLKIS